MDAAKFEEIFSKDNYRLPIRWDGKNFYETLYNHLKDYRKDIEKFRKDYPDLFDDVKAVCRGICAAVDCSFRGYPEKAYDSFKGVMEILGKDPLLIDKEKVKEESLYRVVDVGNAAVPDRRRVFHVPFNMRSKMSTQRYSIPGFPSLYLGTSLELCCMEVGKDPQRDYVCVSRYELQTDERVIDRRLKKDQSPVFDNDKFKIYDISIKPKDAIETSGNIDKDVYVKYIRRYIKWYPLISACSYIRAMRDDHYSAEYIIPQLFIQWVRSENEDAVVGIKYFSCAYEHASTLGYNYVFPTMGIPYHARKTIKNYCARLSHRFKLTVPKFLMDYESIEDCEEQIKEDNNLEYIEGYNDGEGEKIEGEYKIPEGVSAIGVFAFYRCSEMTGIVIPDSVTSIGDYAFSDCSALTTITIPDSVTSIGNFAFSGCSALSNISIPDSVTSFGDFAFDGCSALTSFIIPDSVTSIGDSVFCECSELTSITIPDGVMSIGDSVFYECSELTSITIPDGVMSIGDRAFFNCSELTSINIPKSVTSIGNAAFCGCSALKSIIIPDSVTSIGNFAFYGCSILTFITVDIKNEHYTSVDDIIYNKDKTTLICYPAGKNQKSFKIPDSVTSIGNAAFCGCSALTSIIIPDSVTSIGDSVFYECSALTSIIIPDSVTSFGDEVFYGCEALTSIIIPDSVTSFGDFAFYGCGALTSIIIPDSVTSIGDFAFDGCGALTSIIIPDSVTSIGKSAFFSCIALTCITIPDSVTSIGNYSFSGCSALKTVNYSGTPEQRKRLNIGKGNDDLMKADWV